MKLLSLLFIAFAFTGIAAAGERSSASYRIPTDSADIGGRRTTSASYTNGGSAGLVVGISTVASPAEIAMSGYIGQLHEITGLVFNASPTTIKAGGVGGQTIIGQQCYSKIVL